MKGFFPSSVVQKERPSAGMVARCGACGLYKGCQSPKMVPYGEGAKRVLIVGEAPGATEDEQGRPFVGKAGQLLRETLGAIAVRLDRDAWATNSLICRPPGNEKPDSKQISWCHPNLLNTIREYEPNVIIPLGRAALASVVKPYWSDDVNPMEKWVGWQIPIDQGTLWTRHWICPTYHPSFILRMDNPLMNRIFSDHLESAFAINSPPPRAFNYENHIEILHDERKVVAALKEMDAEGGWVAFDYETNCLKPEYPKAVLFSCSVSNGKRTIAYPMVGRAREATSRFLQSKRTRKIASNLKMEERWTKFFLGHPVRRWGWDTMLAAHCLDNREGICSLKFQSFVKLGVPSYNTNIEPYLKSDKDGHYNRLGEIEIDMLLFYNGMDSILEHQLAMVQMEEMTEL